MSRSILEKSAVREAALTLTVEQYHELSNSGLISEKTELIEGIIVKKITKSPIHSRTVAAIQEILTEIFKNFLIRKEEPLTTESSEPEPDLAVVTGTWRDYETKHPSKAELVVEVAQSTLLLDRDKAALYAAAGIPEYWIVDINEKKLEVYTEPAGEYKKRMILSVEDSIQVNGQLLSVKDIFK